MGSLSLPHSRELAPPSLKKIKNTAKLNIAATEDSLPSHTQRPFLRGTLSIHMSHDPPPHQ